MPRCVRNFWVKVESDARQAPVETGPRRADGEAYIRIFMREDGNVSERSAQIDCRCFPDGTLEVIARDQFGNWLTLAKSQR